MDEHMPPQDPNDPDNTDDTQTDVWGDIGSREPARPLTNDEVMALGAQGLGGEAVKKRYEDLQFYIDRGIGTNDPPLSDDERRKAAIESLHTQQERLDARRDAAETMPAGSDKTWEMARIRTEQNKLDEKRQLLDARN